MIEFLIFVIIWQALHYFTSRTHYTMTETRVEAVSLKLPPFWSNLPVQWFCSIESQFNIRGINQEQTKYDYVIQSLPQEIVASVFDVIQNILDTLGTAQADPTPYTTIKKALVDRNSLSESARVETLLGGIEIGDRKPSEFFRALKTVAGSSDTMSEKLIINLWMRRLPTMIQVSLKSIPNPELSTLLSTADNIYEVLRQERSTNISAISSNVTSSSNEFSFLVEKNRKLEHEISEIKQMISKLSFNNSENHSKSRPRSRSQSRNRNSKFDECWYHYKFGDKAKKCISPCKHSKN